MSLFTLISLLSIFTTSLASSSHEQPRAVRPHQRVFGGNNTLTVQGHQIQKRGDYSGRATYYAAGLGACGSTNSASDYIVALNSAQYGSGGMCYKMITISYGGKSAQAQIVDECPGCPYGALDLSQSLFEHFASTDAGVFYMTWSTSDGSGGGGDGGSPTTSSSQWQEPSSTWTPSSTSQSSTSSTAWSSSSASSSAFSSSSSASSSSASSSSNSTASASATSAPAINADANGDGTSVAQAYEAGNLDSLSKLVIQMGAAAVAGAKLGVQQGGS